jgi:hypothetical protein
MSAARELYTFGPQLVCEPARRIVDPTPAEVLAFTRRQAARQNRGRVSTARVQNPTTIVTSVPIVEWWRADVGVTTGATLNWVGQKNGRVLTQGTGTRQPAYSSSDAAFSGCASFTFDGVDDFLSCTFAIPDPAVTPYFYWYIFKLVAWTLNGALFGSPSGTITALAYCSAVTPNLRPFWAANGTENANTGIGSTRRGANYFSGTASDFLQIGNVTQPGATGAGASGGIVVGSVNGATQFCNFALAELLITSGIPTERSQLDAYGSGRYGGAILI